MNNAIVLAWPLVFTLVGAAVYLYYVQKRPPIAELGRLACFAGLIWLVYLLCGRDFRLGAWPTRPAPAPTAVASTRLQCGSSVAI